MHWANVLRHSKTLLESAESHQGSAWLYGTEQQCPQIECEPVLHFSMIQSDGNRMMDIVAGKKLVSPIYHLPAPQKLLLTEYLLVLHLACF